MHELAITQSVVDLVVERTAGRQVGLVRVEVGALSAVVPDSMQFCYELLTSNQGLESLITGEAILATNDHLAQHNRDWFGERGITAVEALDPEAGSWLFIENVGNLMPLGLSRPSRVSS